MASLDGGGTFSADRITRAVQRGNNTRYDEQAALLSGWNQTYDQMSAGSLSGSLLEVQVDKVL